MPKEKWLYRNLGTWSWTGIFQDADFPGLTFELNTNFCGLGHVCIVLEALALTCGFWRVWENLVHMEISALIPVGEEFPVHPAPCVPVREGVRMRTALMTMASHFIFLICSLWLFTIRSVVIFPNTACGKVLQTIKLYFCWKNTCQQNL